MNLPDLRRRDIIHCSALLLVLCVGCGNGATTSPHDDGGTSSTTAGQATSGTSAQGGAKAEGGAAGAGMAGSTNAGGATAGGSGGGSSQGGECAALQTCCATLGPKKPACEDIAKDDAGVEASCRTSHDLLCPTHTCADLIACCNKLQGNAQTNCLAAANMFDHNDAECSVAYGALPECNQ